MKYLNKRFLVVVIVGLIFCFSNLEAQNVNLKGLVTNKKGDVVNAKIWVKSLNAEYHTNPDGTFEIICERKDKVKFSAKGYSTSTFKPKKDEFIVIRLKKAGNDYAQYNSFEELIEALYPGVVEVNNDEIKVRQFTLEGPRFFIPLLILDGLEISEKMKLLNINTQIIQKVEVLTEPHEIAPYARDKVVIVVKTINSK